MPVELGYSFANPALLAEALTHSSFVNELQGRGRSNEALEFLGDAVLGLVVAHTLLERMPAAAEGTLTRIRSALVTEPSLAQIAAEIGLGAGIRVGKGEAAQGGRERPSLLADALEAVIGAVFLDGGIDPARALVLRLLGSRLDDAVASADLDPKSRIQELVQASHHVTPSYTLLRTWGPDHDRQFEVACLVGEEIRGVGVGRSKKEAAAAAATAALATAQSPPEGENGGTPG